jgi:hypothetical protein
MFNNIFVEPILIEQYHSEFFKLINYYQNLNRNSIFCRYLNINKFESTFDTNTDGTYDKFHSGLRYDVYDYTPLYYSSQSVNDLSDQQDLVGQMIQGNLTLTIYTIQNVSIDDLVVFSYNPQNDSEIFRVANFRLVINSKYSNPAVNWYELTLEYAPIVNYKKLFLLNQYAYDLTLQKYLFLDDFKKTIEETKIFESLFKQLKLFFDPQIELYFYISKSKTKIAPIKQNIIIYNFLTKLNTTKNHFNFELKPFGIYKYLNFNFLNIDTLKQIDEFNILTDLIETIYLKYDIETNDIIPIVPTYYTNMLISTYSGNINIFDICNLIQKWKWYIDGI